MNILALDLGSTTGAAWGDSSLSVQSLTWATDKELRAMRLDRIDRRGDIRVIRFFTWLTKQNATCKFDAVVFEDVQFSSSTAQTQLWSSFRAAVWLAFDSSIIEAVAVGTLKKFATGFGSAKKDQMEESLLLTHPEIAPFCQDDNAVDAVWLWLWASKNLSRRKV